VSSEIDLCKRIGEAGGLSYGKERDESPRVEGAFQKFQFKTDAAATLCSGFAWAEAQLFRVQGERSWGRKKGKNRETLNRACDCRRLKPSSRPLLWRHVRTRHEKGNFAAEVLRKEGGGEEERKHPTTYSSWKRDAGLS